MMDVSNRSKLPITPSNDTYLRRHNIFGSPHLQKSVVGLHRLRDSGNHNQLNRRISQSNVKAEQGEEQPQDAGSSLPAWSGDYSLGDMLGKKYKVLEVLGRGSNGVTYKVALYSDKASTSDGKEVAIKALSLRRMTDWKKLEMFQREAKVLEYLNQPGIPRYLDYFEEDSQQDRGFFLVQELAQGKSLADMVSRGWRADEKEARRIAKEVLGILSYLSSRRPPVVHRDIKPNNIVVEGGKTGGRVFLVDFGGVQAMAAGESFAMGSTVIGTYGYMAPEQFRGAAQPASDLYSLGGTLLYLLSGRQPNEFPQDRMVINFKSSLDVSPEMAAVLEGLLEPVLEDRITAADALNLLSGKQIQQVAREGDQPQGARARVRERRGKMRIDIPPASIVSGNKLGAAGFAVSWNVGIGVWTASAIAAGSIAASLFSIPFWAAGFSIARDVARSTLFEERIDINTKNWSIVRSSRFGSRKEIPVATGKTKDLKGAEVAYNDGSQSGQSTEVQLLEGFKQHSFGRGLSLSEQKWVAAKIVSFLQALPGQPTADIPRRQLTWGEQITEDVNRRIGKELQDSGVDRFIRPGGLGISIGGLQSPFSGGDPYDRYSSYEANILWDQDEISDNEREPSRESQGGLLADSAMEEPRSSSTRTDETESSSSLSDSSNPDPSKVGDNWMTDDLGLISSPEDRSPSRAND